MTGRTSWYPNDAAEHDRELIVELGDEFGPGGPLVMRVMKDLAAQQANPKDNRGQVRTGFRSLAKKCFVERDQARAIIEMAAAIGALDDLVIDDDGRRFECRVSGWAADWHRGRETLKKRAQRAADEDGDMSPDEGDMSPGDGDVSPNCPPTKQNNTTQRGAEAPRRESPIDPNEGRREVHRLCELLAEHMLANDAKAKVAPTSKRWLDAARLLIDADGRDVKEIAHVIRWCQADEFERTVVLSMPKVRERFGQLWQKAQRVPVAAAQSAVSELPSQRQARELRERAARLRAEEAAQAGAIEGTATEAAFA